MLVQYLLRNLAKINNNTSEPIFFFNISICGVYVEEEWCRLQLRR